MILYTKEKCQQCKNVKEYIKSAKIVNIEEKSLSEEAREILIIQGARTMPLLVKNGQLLAQGRGVINYLVELKLKSEEEETFNGMTYPYSIFDKETGKKIAIYDLTVPFDKFTEEEKKEFENEMESYMKNLKAKKGEKCD